MYNLAGFSKVKQRNQDFDRINTELNVFNKYDFIKPDARLVTDYFDLVFMMGDMNYRIDEDYEFIIDCLNNNEIEKLRDRDQFKIEARNSKCELSGFDEGKIKFPPTYKYVPGTDVLYYDGDKLPGWTDRIL